MLPTYGPGRERLRGGRRQRRGDGELLGAEFVVSDEAVRGQAEVRQELDEELVALRNHRPAISEWEGMTIESDGWFTLLVHLRLTFI